VSREEGLSKEMWHGGNHCRKSFPFMKEEKNE
jgi:hypothetical protein